MDTAITCEPIGDFTARIGLHVDGERVSGLYVHRRRMRIGCAQVVMGGIGGVATAQAHRMKGYSRHCMEHSIEFMRAAGCDVSMLFGIRDFYPKWGFATMLPDSHITLKTEHAAAASSELPVRPFQPADMPAVLAIYEANNAVRSCSVIRDAHFPDDRLPMGTRFFTRARLFVVTAGAGTIIGYAGVDDEIRDGTTGDWKRLDGEMEVCEVGASRPDAHAAIVAELARQAAERSVAEINVYAPTDHPFAEACCRYECEVYARYPRDGGGMLRIVNQETLFAKALPELQRRAALAVVAGVRGGVRLVTGLGETVLRVREGGVELGGHAEASVELPQWALLQLLIGYRSVADVLAGRQVTVAGDPQRVLEALFPSAFPYIWRPDWF